MGVEAAAAGLEDVSTERGEASPSISAFGDSLLPSSDICVMMPRVTGSGCCCGGLQ
jgi:hypothetical protein